MGVGGLKETKRDRGAITAVITVGSSSNPKAGGWVKEKILGLLEPRGSEKGLCGGEAF